MAVLPKRARTRNLKPLPLFDWAYPVLKACWWLISRKTDLGGGPNE